MPVARRTQLATSCLLAAFLVVAGCSDKSEIGPGSIVTVRVDPDTLNVVLGTRDTLKAFPLDDRGSFLPNRRVTWSSGDASVATVDADGTVTGVGLGMTMVTATHDPGSGSAVVLVVPSP